MNRRGFCKSLGLLPFAAGPQVTSGPTPRHIVELRDAIEAASASVSAFPHDRVWPGVHEYKVGISGPWGELDTHEAEAVLCGEAWKLVQPMLGPALYWRKRPMTILYDSPLPGEEDPLTGRPFVGQEISFRYVRFRMRLGADVSPQRQYMVHLGHWTPSVPPDGSERG